MELSQSLHDNEYALRMYTKDFQLSVDFEVLLAKEIYEHNVQNLCTYTIHVILATILLVCMVELMTKRYRMAIQEKMPSRHFIVFNVL